MMKPKKLTHSDGVQIHDRDRCCNYVFVLLIVMSLIILSCRQPLDHKPGWPDIKQETKPWTRWWWHGSALTKKGITVEMEAYKYAGVGGLEITPIYGVYGYESEFKNYLTPEWMELLMHTLKEAERLGLGIDMATGTGWPFGGPWVDDNNACKNLNVTIFTLTGGESLKGKVEFIQEPFVRVVGNQLHEIHRNDYSAGNVNAGSIKEPVMLPDTKQITIEDLTAPIANNRHLQALALDQVKFEKKLSLITLMAYGSNGDILDLTAKVDASGKLNWVAPGGTWKLYSIFEGWHGKMVERAAPGGEGNVIDHFSSTALQTYLYHLDSAFEKYDLKPLRSFFNDSYEVDDARGSADWTPALFEEFAKRRGYDLKEHLPALFGHDTEERNRRVLCDYRETISELVLNNFTIPWKIWAHEKSALVRNQAHGSPSNILDLYATVDIPEIEGTDPLRIKMASSAGNVAGKNLVSSESATWLNEHFESDLSDIKAAVDRFLLNGVNHIFYHGTSYSPAQEPWPGWLFYAAVHLNPRNPMWADFHALNDYVARCQSFLQNSGPDNDVLLYFPIYDRFSSPGQGMIEHFDGVGKEFDGTHFKAAAELMLNKGISFDFISDKQIANIILDDKSLKTEGGAVYKTIVLPHCRYMPLSTIKKIVSLAEEGATIILYPALPLETPGLKDHDTSGKELIRLSDKIGARRKSIGSITEMPIGKGRLLAGADLNEIFSHAAIQRETLIDAGLKFIRKKTENGPALYFIVNDGARSFKGWVPVSVQGQSAVLYDPMDGRYGIGKTRNSSGKNEVYMQLNRDQAIILEVYNEKVNSPLFNYFNASQDSVRLTGSWTIDFVSGGPELPPKITTNGLASWTDFDGDVYRSFSGTAAYTLLFKKPLKNVKGWILDLGNVKETAQVSVNGNLLGTFIGPVYQVYVDNSLLKENNVLEVRVSNLMANRIAYLDRHKIFWKKFYNVNFPARMAENRTNGLFDASHWEPRPSGLLGPVWLKGIAD